MKHWFKFIVKGADGTYEGTEFIKAESVDDAKNILVEDWADYPYVDDVEAYELRNEPLSTEQEQDALDNLPESLQDSERANAMACAVDNLDEARAEVEGIKESLDNVSGYLEEAKG